MADVSVDKPTDRQRVIIELIAIRIMHGVCQKRDASRKQQKGTSATSIVLNGRRKALAGRGNSLTQNRLHEMDVQRPEGAWVCNV